MLQQGKRFDGHLTAIESGAHSPCSGNKSIVSLPLRFTVDYPLFPGKKTRNKNACLRFQGFFPMQLGYARISTSEQNIDGQIEALRDAGCEKVFADRGVGGDRASRPELDKLLEQLRAGDVVVVQALDRLARSLRLLLSNLEDLKNRGVGIRSLREPLIDTTTASGELVLQIFWVIAEFERRRSRERIHAGLDHFHRHIDVVAAPNLPLPFQRIARLDVRQASALILASTSDLNRW